MSVSRAQPAPARNMFLRAWEIMALESNVPWVCSRVSSRGSLVWEASWTSRSIVTSISVIERFFGVGRVNSIGFGFRFGAWFDAGKVVLAKEDRDGFGAAVEDAGYITDAHTFLAGG